MATPAQLAANRANARKSTGPRTVEGKQRASMNPLKHGLTAATLVLPHEDNLAFQEMRGSLYMQYQPATPQECMLVDQLASGWWRTIRVRQVETDMLDLQVQTLNSKYPDKKASPKSDRQALAVRFVTESEKDFSNFLRYDANIERAFYRALNTLEKLQAARKRADARQPVQDTQPADAVSEPEYRKPIAMPAHVIPITATNHMPPAEIGFVSPPEPWLPKVGSVPANRDENS